MPSLRELQDGFVADILAGGKEASTLARASRVRESGRMAVYRRTIRANYRNAMSATYPAVRRIVGTSFFHAAVDAYVEAHPSRAGDLNEYGDAFGDFLAGYAPAGELPYLPDVARLEWRIDEANRAGDSSSSPPAVLGALSQVPEDSLPALRLAVEPSCRFIASTFPLLAIWRVNQPGYSGDLRIDFSTGPDRLRIRRESSAAAPQGEGNGIAIDQLEAGEFEWLSALASGETFAGAIERALAADSAFDLQAVLHRFIGDGSIAGRLTG